MSSATFMKTTASTLKKVAELPRYRHPADLINMEVRSIRLQRMEIQGQSEFGQNNYISESHEKLVKELLNSRKKYRTQSIENRAKIASHQYDQWKLYLQDQVSRIPNSELIEGDKKQKVYESYLIAKERNQQKMQLSRTVKLCYQISKGFKFDIALHPLVLMRLVYPHLGYLINFKDQRLPFDEYVRFLEEMITVSKFFYQGNTLHGSQLMSFVFWKAFTPKPTLQLDQFCKFLTNFKFNSKPESFSKDFQYNLKDREGEVKDGVPVRFELWRSIYLERGL